MNDKRDMYLPPSTFFAEVIRCKISGKISDDLSRMFMLLAEKVANHRWWIRYAHLRDDIISENIFACLKGFDQFSPYTKAHIAANGDWNGEDQIEYDYRKCYNPHAWFTTCCFNNLRQFMKREYNQINIHNKMKIENGLDPSFGYAEMIAELEKEHGDGGGLDELREGSLWNDADEENIERFDDEVEEHEVDEDDAPKPITDIQWH